MRRYLIHFSLYTHTPTAAQPSERGACYLLKTEDECVASKDGRANYVYHGDACHWCCGDACIHKGNKCEPSGYLAEQPNNASITSRNGHGYNSCPGTCGGCFVLWMIVLMLVCQNFNSFMYE